MTTDDNQEAVVLIGQMLRQIHDLSDVLTAITLASQPGRHEYDVAEHAIANGENENDRPVFNESVLPIVEAGLVEYVDDGFQIDHGVVVHAAPGHTEGHMVVHAKSNARSGIFCGDVIHHPLQLRYPHINSMACRDPEQAASTRRAVLTDCAEHDRLLMPVHFAGSSCGHVRHDKDVYAWEELNFPDGWNVG